MAESINVITHGMSGMIGDVIVFRQRAGKTFTSAAPRPTEHKPSAAELQHRQQFQEAIIYGKQALTDTKLKEEYQAQAKPGQSAFNVAVADLLHAPDIDTVDLSNYMGKVGDTITIRATDDFMVTGVTISISDADGTLVEKGAAVLGSNGLDWVYTATVANLNLSGDKIVVLATDLPGNVTEKDETLP